MWYSHSLCRTERKDKPVLPQLHGILKVFQKHANSFILEETKSWECRSTCMSSSGFLTVIERYFFLAFLRKASIYYKNVVRHFRQCWWNSKTWSHSKITAVKIFRKFHYCTRIMYEEKKNRLLSPNTFFHIKRR